MYKALPYLIVQLMALYGIGFAGLLVIFTGIKKQFSVSQTVIVGIAITGVIVLLANLFFVITPGFSFVLLGAGISFAVAGIVSKVRDPEQRVKCIAEWLCLFLLVIASLNIVSRFDLGVINVDTGGYHLPSVKWFKDSLVPLGVGHLNYMLAFNNFNFSVAAGLWTNTEHFLEPFLLNSVYFIVFFGALFGGVVFEKKNSILQVLTSVAIAVCLFKFRREFLYAYEPMNSVTSDLGVAVFSGLSLLFFMGTLESKSETREKYIVLFCITTLLAVTHKISMILLLGPLAWLVWQLRSEFKKYRPLLVFCSVFGLAWVLRTFLLSGCVLFPAAKTCIPSLPWALTPEIVDYTSRVVESMAKNKTTDVNSISHLNWLSTWWESYSGDVLIVAIIVSSLLLIVAAVLLLRKKEGESFSKNAKIGWFIFWLCVVGSCALWFLKAPMPRYGRASQFLLVSLNVSLFLFCFNRVHQFLEKHARTCMTFFFVVFTTLLFLKDYPPVPSLWSRPWPEEPVVSMKEETNHQGKVFYVNSEHFSCWNLPNPCMWSFDPKITTGKYFDVWPVFIGVHRYNEWEKYLK